MTDKSKNPVTIYRGLIYENQLKWLEAYRSFVAQGKILVVGHGLGYTTEIISKINPDVIGLDIALEAEALLKEKVIVYDGIKIPFGDGEFEAVVAGYVLHHAVDPAGLFSEMVRVSRSKIIVLEETYENFFQKLDLVYFDWWFNRKAGQRVDIRWNSYLTPTTLRSLASQQNLKLERHKEEPLRSYKTELIVFTK